MSGYCKDCGNQVCLCDEIEISIKDQKNKANKKIRKEVRDCLTTLLKILNNKFSEEIKSINLSSEYEKGYCSAFEVILELIQIHKEELFKIKK